jgi:hypothetical protein
LVALDNAMSRMSFSISAELCTIEGSTDFDVSRRNRAVLSRKAMEMRRAVFVFVLLAAALGVLPAAADQSSLTGTWSGDWTPKDQFRAITIELKQADAAGAVTGRFVAPFEAEFERASVTKTGMVKAEATDKKSGTRYTLEGKVQGTEIRGTLNAGDLSGDLLLIKWTFFGR